MSQESIYVTQYLVFGILFLSGCLAYIWVARKLKDPAKIYEEQLQTQPEPKKATGTH